MTKKLIFTFVGPKGQDVDLAEFVSVLDSFSEGLTEADKALSKGQGSQFVVTDLSHSSPATVTVEEFCGNGSLYPLMPIFWAGLKSVERNGKKPKKMMKSLFEALNRAVECTQRSAMRTVARFGSEEIRFKQKSSVKTIIETETEVVTGSYEGLLDNIRLIKDRNTFCLYPVDGTKFDCHFPDHLLETVLEGRRKTITASGDITFDTVRNQPQEMVVDQIEVAPDYIKGQFRNLRGSSHSEISSVEYIRNFRETIEL